MAQYGMIIDYKYCTGCHVCEVACRQEKNIPLDEWGIKLAQIGPQKMGGAWEWDYVPMPTDLCDLCADRVAAGKRPACMKHCLADCMQLVAAEDISSKMMAAGSKVVSYIPLHA